MVALVKRWIGPVGRTTAAVRLESRSIEPRFAVKINRRLEVNDTRMG
ncbi:hypothetical protein N826_37925 [Skermanella aerolata KACC 11604]|nr:hypothetical protein N826_37925 [Skermanella aerolata KACC 11604]